MIDCSRSHVATFASKAVLSLSSISEAIPKRANVVGGAMESPNREWLNDHALQSRVEEVKCAATTTSTTTDKRGLKRSDSEGGGAMV